MVMGFLGVSAGSNPQLFCVDAVSVGPERAFVCKVII